VLRSQTGSGLVIAICAGCMEAIAAALDPARPQVIPVGALEVAQVLGVRRGTVHTWKQRGVLPPPQAGTVSGEPWWTLDDIKEWARGRALPSFLRRHLMVYATDTFLPVRTLPAETDVDPIAFIPAPGPAGEGVINWVVFNVGTDRYAAPQAQYEQARRA
jgi:hypothetical protein